MSDPVGSISGVSSGIQWRDMVDQIMAIEAQRRYNPVADRRSALIARADAWQQFQGIVAKFRDAAATLQRATAFDAYTATATKSSVSGRDLISVSAGTGAAPGSYSVEVLATARAEKLGGAVVSDATAALGITGSFALNGRAITLTAADTLRSLRDKINLANSGTNASGVSATIIAAGGGSRLMLTSSATGASGIEITGSGDGTIEALGLSNGVASANFAADGSTQTFRFASRSAAVTSMLSVSLPSAPTIKVGGQIVAVDLAVDSLDAIATKINAATGDTSSAQVRSETIGGKTFYRLATNATIEVDDTNAADSARTLAALGFTTTGRPDTTHKITSVNTFTDASTGLDIMAASLATDLRIGGQSLGVGAGDTINISGMRGDGSTVTKTVAIGAGTTVQNVLDAINDATTGFGAGARTAVASLAGGRIVLTDAVAGGSQLALQLTTTRAGGGSVTLGAFDTGNGGAVGVSGQLTSGADAVIRVDGQTIRRATNVITDAINGVTLSALTAELGATSQVNVSVDTDTITKTMQDFVASYNAVRAFVTANSAANGALANSTTLRAMGGMLPSTMLRDVVGVSGTLTTASLAGLQHDKNGVLSLNLGTFKNALATNYDALRQLFGEVGTATDPEVSFSASTEKTEPGASPYAIAITQAATRASVDGAIWANYVTTGGPDTFTLTDGATNVSGSITIANGDSIDVTVQKLNAMFASRGMQLAAEKTVDSRLRITSKEYGTSGGFTTAFTPAADGDGTATLGISAQAFTGLDVTGTINGAAATGKGQILTSSTGVSNGLAIRYTGSTARAAGTLAFSIGVGGALARTAQSMASDGTGGAAAQSDAARVRASALEGRLSDIQARLEQRRLALTRQFIAMEGALARAQSIGGALTAQINSLRSMNS